MESGAGGWMKTFLFLEAMWRPGLGFFFVKSS